MELESTQEICEQRRVAGWEIIAIYISKSLDVVAIFIQTFRMSGLRRLFLRGHLHIIPWGLQI
jgi:hypothetical protein